MRVRSIADAAAAVRGRRLDLGLSQDQLARRAGVSRKWIYEFEAGKPAAALGHVMRVLETLGLHVAISTEASGSTAAAMTDLDALLEEHRRA